MSLGRGKRLKNVKTPLVVTVLLDNWWFSISYDILLLRASDASLFSTFYLRWIVLGQPPLQWRVEDKPNHLKQIQEKVTRLHPSKITTKPTNHPIEKENHLPNIYFFGSNMNFPWCKPWNLVTAGGTELAFTAPGAFTFFTAPLTIAARSSQSESTGNLIATQLRVCEAA